MKYDEWWLYTEKRDEPFSENDLSYLKHNDERYLGKKDKHYYIKFIVCLLILFVLIFLMKITEGKTVKRIFIILAFIDVIILKIYDVMDN